MLLARQRQFSLLFFPAPKRASVSFTWSKTCYIMAEALLVSLGRNLQTVASVCEGNVSKITFMLLLAVGARPAT